ncbi:MAG: shikimate dehydrogenase [Betaproteobacteria bacterium]|nr:shikimate dehydrogenase [Betaproteobacteria bacterium]
MANTAALRAACIIGWPVGHSRSPLMHNHWIGKYGIHGIYRREAVAPEDFPRFIASLADRGYVGANVTQPHKEMALRLSAPDAGARAVGVANTLWYEHGRLQSTNTDVEGFVGALDASAPGWDRTAEQALVIGAGGAARAVIFGLLARGVQRMHVVNRTIEKAETLRAAFGPKVVPAEWSRLPDLLKAANVITNATELGMHGRAELAIDLGPARDDALVADVVYVPVKTALLEQATRRGLRTSDGLEMLLYQAGRGFEKWFGVRPTVTPELRAIMEQDIGGKK